MDLFPRRLSRGTEVQEEKALPPEIASLLTVNPVSGHSYIPPWAASASASLSASVFPFGLSNFHGASALCGGSHRNRDQVTEMELMFSKILTPSDIGKLNRFLIPRQDAEKFFPMGASRPRSNRVSFLTFEDSTGRMWHFRYCFWSSSRTYALTRGWTNFVQAKKLNDGDLVSFYQGAGAAGGSRRFIRFRQRAGVSMPPPEPAAVPRSLAPALPGTLSDDQPQRRGLRFRRSIDVSGPPGQQPLCYGSAGAGTAVPQAPMASESVALGNGEARTEKHVRLFGVNLVVPDPGSAA